MSLAATDEVDSESRGGTTRDVWFPWTFRRILALPGSPFAIGIGAGLLSLVVTAAWFNASGMWHGYRREGIPIWLHPSASYELAWPVFLGYAAVALIYLVRGAHRDLSQLGPALGLAPGPLAEVRREVLSVPARSLRVGTALGLAIAAFDLRVIFAYANLEGFSSMTQLWVLTREILYNVLVFRVLTWAIVVAIRLSRLARERVHVNLVDLEPLRPFSQNGNRLALFWLLLWAIWAPTLFLIPAERNVLLASAILMGVGIALSAAAIAIPTLGVHRRLSETKAAELAEVRGTIESDRAAALDPNHPDRTAAATRLPGLLAYEARVAAVPEWLLDSHSLRRVGLYLLIPVASWVGGAMIERLVDSALD
ncbi:MAG: hypothetical protein JRG80_18965 [Deltaproteobacteria bacterium]|nr:hypothetical protein [Deltaproteobacteria bacterium]MBW2401306.1 hypothetical protein [Deltaproteobacteria bacterium]MBW2665525.1 hypothetical protein [Deltaproteobacteria bacterium]